MIYWQRCQSEIAKALGMQISDINNEKLYIAACNGDWNAYQGLVTGAALQLSLIHISEPTRRTPISYAVFCLKKKKHHTYLRSRTWCLIKITSSNFAWLFKQN